MEDIEVENPKLKQEIRKEIKRAKGFGLKIITVILGVLFVISIAVCALFATGMLVVRQSDDGSSRLEYVSPFREVQEDSEKKSNNSTNNNTNNSSSEPTNNPDDNSQNTENITAPTLAGFDFKISELISSAKEVYSDSEVSVLDIRATTDGKYIVVELLLKNGKYADAKYYYRATTGESQWTLISALSPQAAPKCSDLSDKESEIIKNSFTNINKCRDENDEIKEL